MYKELAKPHGFVIDIAASFHHPFAMHSSEAVDITPEPKFV
jgi:hypothetical protein